MSAETQKQQQQQQQQQALHSGMKRHFYSQHSSTQGNAVDLCREMLLQAATDMPLPSNTTTTDNQANAALHGEQQQHGCHCCCCINVAEWGCSHGANSIAPVALTAEVLQQRLAVGCSMYSRNFPRASLSLGFSFSSLHWQSSSAVRLSRTVNPGCSKTTPEEHAALRAHAISDLSAFLRLRGEEFVPSGLLLLCYVGYSDAVPLSECGSVSGVESLLSGMAFHDAAQAVAEGMVADGLLQLEDLGSMAAPVYFLDEASQRGVYADVADTWELLSFDIVDNVSPMRREYQEGRASNEQQAAVFVNFWRALMEPFMQQGLARPAAGRSAADVAALLATFFERMTAAALANLQPASYPAARVLLRRAG
ncbi:hypothetical protein OEZ85_002995 [Tetradesmus obliquus]|uniref:Uncharacterized protein n=1 Tax=Tetradesmus obliquus TaxID=3088 RepID=A0ABY8TZQ0_TETOB|nr:hypothetical protein OEZ85_002995 [Tetradesmus obliquus]